METLVLQSKIKIIDRIQSVQRLRFVLHHVCMFGWVQILELFELSREILSLARNMGVFLEKGWISFVKFILS